MNDYLKQMIEKMKAQNETSYEQQLAEVRDQIMSLPPQATIALAFMAREQSHDDDPHFALIGVLALLGLRAALVAASRLDD